MPRSIPLIAVPLSALVLAFTGCGTAAVNMDEPRRVVGTESAVRVDAEIIGEELGGAIQLPITYEITNDRANAIAVADIVPVTSFDPETGVVTVDLGSEVPGAQLLPRLISIPPGQKRVFTTSAKLNFAPPVPSVDPRANRTPSLRLRVSFLGDVAPFRELLDIEAKAVADPARADELFPAWVEHNEVVYTNALPMRWRVRSTSRPQPGGF